MSNTTNTPLTRGRFCNCLIRNIFSSKLKIKLSPSTRFKTERRNLSKKLTFLDQKIQSSSTIQIRSRSNNHKSNNQTIITQNNQLINRTLKPPKQHPVAVVRTVIVVHFHVSRTYFRIWHGLRFNVH